MIMDKLRAAANSTVLKIVFIIIILSFLLTGISGYLVNNSNNYIAKVNNITISHDQLNQAFQQEKQELQELLGDQFTKIISSNQVINMLNHQALERLINVILFNQYSNKLGLIITDDKIKQHIYNMSIFQTNGHFNNKKYLSILSTYNININDLVQEIKQNLINSKLSKIYITDEFVLPEEVNYYAKFFLQKRKVKIANLSFIKYQSKQIVTNKELQDYYNIHKNNFVSPEQVKVSYIKLNSSNKYKNQVIQEEEIKRYYNKNISRYTQNEKKHYSMIKLATKKDIDYIFKSLSNGVDCKQLIKEKSIYKFNIVNCSSLGWMEDNFTPNEILIANLTKKGEFSNIIKSNNGYIIFRLDDIKPKIVKSLQSVKNEIIYDIKNKKTINEFYLLQKTASRIALNENESLKAVENAINIKAVTTDWFNRNNIPKEIKFDKIINFIFNKKLLDKNRLIGVNSDVINIDDNNSFIIRIEKYKTESIKPFNQVIKMVFKLVKMNKAIKNMEEDNNKLLTLLKYKTSEDALKKLGINFSNIKIINRFGKNDSLSEAIFQMPIPKKNIPTYFSIKDSKNNLIIIKLIEVISVKPTQKELKVFSKRFKTMFSNMIIESLILNLRDNANIEIYK
ncbi:MAG: peptidylprolyl isomerase [Arsenophonus endosymbiont of Ceratovacuna japonica]